MPTISEQKATVIQLIQQLSHETESIIQLQIAPLLRTMALDYIEQGGKLSSRLGIDDHQVAEPFSIREQRNNGKSGTDIELEALCQLFNINCRVFLGEKPRSFCYEIGSNSDVDAPTIVIHYSKAHGGHFYREHYQDTLGNGNCLFNALAVRLHELFNRAPTSAKTNLKNPVKVEPITSLGHSRPSVKGLFSIALQDKIKQHQVSRWQQILSSSPTFNSHADTVTSLKEENTRINSLSIPEQEQINNDYKLALSVAQDEIESVEPTRCRL